MRIDQIAYHRNGVSGEPFYVVKFRAGDDAMLAVVFDMNEEDAFEASSPTNPRTAVFDRKQLGEGVIAFGENSHRGDRYDRELRQAIVNHERRLHERTLSEEWSEATTVDGNG